MIWTVFLRWFFSSAGSWRVQCVRPFQPRFRQVSLFLNYVLTYPSAEKTQSVCARQKSMLRNWVHAGLQCEHLTGFPVFCLLGSGGQAPDPEGHELEDRSGHAGVREVPMLMPTFKCILLCHFETRHACKERRSVPPRLQWKLTSFATAALT